jgi:hypothetical protein
VMLALAALRQDDTPPTAPGPEAPSPIEGNSCRARRTRSHASGIKGLSFVSKLKVASVGFQCNISRPAPSGRA